MYVIEASVRGSAQWSPFYVYSTNTIGYIGASAKALRESLKDLRSNAAYSVLSFRISLYARVEQTSATASETTTHDNNH